MALLDKWIALDMGAYLARFYDFSTQKQIVLKTIIAKKGKETLGVSDQALAYLYKDLDTTQIQYPISHGQILHSIEPLIHEGLDRLHAFDGLFRPSVLVSVPSELSQRQRELWQQAFLNCGVRKVEFISNLEVVIAIVYLGLKDAAKNSGGGSNTGSGDPLGDILNDY